MSKTAISFNVPPKLWADFKQQTDELFLSRAPFLDYMVRNELPHLRADLKGLKLSLRAKRHIAGAMKRQGPVSVNIEVRPETADALRAAMAEHNLVRDAFMSRLVIFLRSTDGFLKLIGLPTSSSSRIPSMGLEDMPASPLGAMEAVRDDPLYYIRAQVEHGYSCGIYRMPLPRRLDWAACYLADEDIPGTPAHRRQQKFEDELVSLATGSPATAAKRRRVKR